MKKMYILLMLGIMLGGCSKTNDIKNTKIEEVVDETKISEKTSEIIDFSNLNTISDEVQSDGTTITINKAGDYVLQGQSENGQVIINAPDEEVNITLKNLDLSSTTTSAITVIDADKVNIILEGETTLSDTEQNTDTYQAPLFIDEVETHILGDGILNLNGNYQEGLESNNDLYIDGGTLNINAVDDGINAGDLLSINDGIINIDSNGDGLDSNGDLEITGGEIYISAGNNGNGPIDYGEGYSFTLTGGTVIATGGSMGVVPTTQGQEFLTTTTQGESVDVEDYSYVAPKTFSYVFISYDGLQTDTPVLVDGIETTTTQEVSQGGGRGMMGEPSMM